MPSDPPLKPQYHAQYERAIFEDLESGPRWVVGDETWAPVGGHPFSAEEDEFGEWVDRHIPDRRPCAFCGLALEGIFVDGLSAADCEDVHRAEIESGEHDPEVCRDIRSRFGEDFIYKLWVCRGCGFWQWFSTEFHRGGADSAILTAVARTFEKRLPNGCVGELAQQLTRNPGRLGALAPKALERLVANVFRANHQTSEVRHVGRPADGGVDVLFIDDGDREWIVQVKRRSDINATEGVDVVRALLGTMLVRGQAHGMVVSTADHYSHFAHDEALRAIARSKGLVQEVLLVDRHALRDLLGNLVATDGWKVPLHAGQVAAAEQIAALEQYCEERLTDRRRVDLFDRQLALFPGWRPRRKRCRKR